MPIYKDIEYSLSKSKRKTASIYIERDGKVSVLVPEEFSQEEIDVVLKSRLKWIYTNLAEWQDLNVTKTMREFISGEGFLYLGSSYRLKIVSEQDCPLKLKNGYFNLCLKDKKITPKIAFKDFYKEKGLKRISDRVEIYSSNIGVSPKKVRVIELKNRWASCSGKETLNFHWKCMMAPLTILDYIVVHELVHLKYPNHTNAFWNGVDKVMSDYKDRKNWLKINGAGMDI